MPTLYYTDYSNPFVSQIRALSLFLGTEIILQKIPNKFAPFTFVDQSLVINDPVAISFHLASGSKILGEDFQTQVDVYSWIQYFNLEVYPLIFELYNQIFGKSAYQQQRYNYALEQLKKVLKVIDERLRLKSYIVGDNLTVADITLCCHLETAFRLIVNGQIRKKLVNLTRWYSFVRNLQPFLHTSGKMFLCETPLKISTGVVERKQQGQKVQKTKEAKSKQNKKEVKKDGKKQEKEEPKKVQKKQKQEKEEPKKVQKKQQQIEQNQKEQTNSGKFNLDNFKRSFQNTPNKQVIIEQFLNAFDYQGWSIWKVYYNKDVTEGKVDYLTCNLAKGTLQRLDGLRKNAFGNWGVYFSKQTNEFQIRGVMMWKGIQISPVWKQHPSYEYHIFHKLNPENPEHRKIVMQYWLETEICEGLELNSSFRLI